MGLTAVGALAGGKLLAGAEKPKGIRQSVCRWCYGKIPLDQFAAEAARIGYQSIELVNREDLPTLKKYGLTCALFMGGGTISKGLNRTENHDRCVSELKSAIDLAAAEKLPNVITFSGNREGMDDEEGMANCVEGLKKIAGYAEQKGVTVCLELLNSKVDHKDYMADHTAWGAGVVKKVGSDRVKLLYDIYHMQIMEGDVIRTIRENHQYIGHYHTAGVPGRNEINETQELNYPAIMRAILDLNYQGFVGQEYVPKGDPLAALAEGYRICNV